MCIKVRSEDKSKLIFQAQSHDHKRKQEKKEREPYKAKR
jgi:hypothetical protein